MDPKHQKSVTVQAIRFRYNPSGSHARIRRLQVFASAQSDTLEQQPANREYDISRGVPVCINEKANLALVRFSPRNSIWFDANTLSYHTSIMQAMHTSDSKRPIAQVLIGALRSSPSLTSDLVPLIIGLQSYVHDASCASLLRESGTLHFLAGALLEGRVHGADTRDKLSMLLITSAVGDVPSSIELYMMILKALRAPETRAAAMSLCAGLFNSLAFSEVTPAVLQGMKKAGPLSSLPESLNAFYLIFGIQLSPTNFSAV